MCETRRRFGTISFEVCEIVYAVRDDPANWKGLKVNGTLQNLFCADGANLLGDILCVEEIEEGLSWSLPMELVQWQMQR